MRLLLIHQFGPKKIQLLERRFRYENIHSSSVDFHIQNDKNLNELIFSHLIEANAIVFYIQSPDQKSSLSLLPELAKKVKIPILILDEKESLETKIYSRKVGADVYASQPFSIPQIATKLKFLTYRKNFNSGGTLKVKNIHVDLGNRMVRRNGSMILLRNKEFALLEFFLLNRGRILTRNNILENVWDRNTSLFSNTVDVHIARLRKKLGDISERNPLIKTIHCVGYCFQTPEKALRTKHR